MHPIRSISRLGTTLVLGLWTALVTSGDVYVDASANCGAANGTAANPYCRIQQGIGVAGWGDRVLIAPGTYIENLQLRKDVSLVGLEGSAATIVRASVAWPVVTLVTGTTHTLTGLTLEGGSGYQIQYPGRRESRGGGIFMGATTAELTLDDVVVRGNRASSYLDRNEGGGIYNYGGTLTIRNSTITDNRVGLSTLGYFGAQRGGGISSGGTLTLVNSTVSDNEVETYLGATGGGLFVSGAAVLRDTLIHGNRVRANYSAYGAAVHNAGQLTMERCTLSRNSGGYPAQVITNSTASTVMESSILWGNSPPGYSGYGPILGATTTVRNSVVETGWNGPGSGILDQDPKFLSPFAGDFRLAADSPCIDAGDSGALPVGLDLAGNPRLQDGDLDRLLRVDMGAFEYANGTLAVSGDATPGGTLQIDTEGLAGLHARLALSIFPAQAIVQPVGIVFFDLSKQVKLVSLGSVPTSMQVTLPPTLGVPLDAILQVLFIGDPLPSGRVPANLSNPVYLRVE